MKIIYKNQNKIKLDPTGIRVIQGIQEPAGH